MLAVWVNWSNQLPAEEYSPVATFMDAQLSVRKLTPPSVGEFNLVGRSWGKVVGLCNPFAFYSFRFTISQPMWRSELQRAQRIRITMGDSKMFKGIALLMTAGIGLLACQSSHAAEKEGKKMTKPLTFVMKSLDGKDVDLSKYQGKVVLIVNVASKCGLTPQYEQLQALHEKHVKDGLAVLGFPCNQFRSQEPGTAEQIKEFCRVNYGVTFDLFAKIEVNGDGACGLYKLLTALDTKPAGPGPISWNFEKFIVGRNGEVVARFAPRTTPDDPEVLKVIEAELAKK